MAIRDRLLDLERRFKRLAGEPLPREPLEIRQAVLQAVTDMTRPTGRGRRVLPFDGLDVDLLAESEEARRVLHAVLQRDEGLEAAMRRALADCGCTVPASFTITLRYRRKPPAGWQAGQRFALRGHAAAASAASVPTAPAGPDPVAGLPVVVLWAVKGRAARKAVEIASERINLGRGEEVADRDQRLVRRNHFVFVEGDQLSDTVSRAHAHIRCSPAGECRLRDDGSAHGTRIVRAGRTIDVSPGNTRGVKLQAGDELHLGRATLRFEFAAVATPGE